MATKTFHMPRENQGQIVEVSYMMIDGVVIRRIYDRSDRTAKYATSEAADTDEGDYWNHEPNNSEWLDISEAEFNRMMEQ